MSVFFPLSGTFCCVFTSLLSANKLVYLARTSTQRGKEIALHNFNCIHARLLRDF